METDSKNLLKASEISEGSLVVSLPMKNDADRASWGNIDDQNLRLLLDNKVGSCTRKKWFFEDFFLSGVLPLPEKIYRHHKRTGVTSPASFYVHDVKDARCHGSTRVGDCTTCRPVVRPVL